MKKYFKGLLFRFLIFLGIVFAILIIIDKIIYFSDESLQWIPEDLLINRMNSNKLQNSTWDEDKIIFKYMDDGPLPDKGNKKRILVVGDSFIWGHGYSNLNHLWWKQLARILYTNGYTDVEVVAAGASGYSTEQEFNNILKNEKVMKELDPDLIIIGYVENDPQFRDENYNDLLPAIRDNDIFYGTKNPIINFIKTVFPNIYSKVIQQVVRKYMQEPWFQERFGLQYNLWTSELTNDPWKTMYEEKVLSKLYDYINNELDCPLFFVPMSSFPSRSQEIYYIISEFEGFHIPYYSAVEEFCETYPDETYSLKEWGINPANGHPSVKATLFYAEFVFKVLEKDFSDIIGTKYDRVELNLKINDWLPYSLKPVKLSNNYYKITYPAKDDKDSFLSLPVRKDYVKLNLEFPINIKSIEITGDNIQSIEIFTNSINEDLGYDDQVMKSIGKKNKNFVWQLNDNDMITSINISAKIKSGESTDLYIKFKY